MKNAKKLTRPDLIFIKFLDAFRSAIFLSSIYDVVLYSSHEILHHDLKIEQISTGRLSYYLAVLCLTICVFDLIKIYTEIRDFNFVMALKYEKSVLLLSRDTNLLKNDKKKLKKAGENTEKIEEKINLLKEKRTYMTKNWLYQVGSITTTLTEGIRLEALHKQPYSRYYRYLKIIKVVMFELCTASLQILPKAQISLIFSIQLWFFLTTIYYIFIKKIFKSFFWSFVEICSEFTILVFLGMGLLMEFLKRGNIEYEIWTRLQFYCIFLVVLTSGINIIALLLTISGQGIWKLGALINYDGFFGTKWVDHRVSKINEILQEMGEKIQEEKPDLKRVNKISKREDGAEENIGEKKEDYLFIERGIKFERFLILKNN